MIRSLLLKLGMLVVTASAVVWVGWPKASEGPGTGAVGSTPEVKASAPGLPAAPAEPRTSPAPDAVSRRLGAVRSGQPSIHGTDAKLDLNRATAEDFERLPGIGPVLAKALLQDRESHGPFRTVEELKRVKGIGAKRLEQVRPLVMVQESASQVRKPR